jgi:hypothetical protein
MKIFFIASAFSLIGFWTLAQDSTFLSKNRLPYLKTKRTKLLYINLTGYTVLDGRTLDNQFLIETIPTFAYYFSKKLEGVFQYHFGFLKYGSLSSVRSDIFNRFSAALHFYPLKKLNFIYAETGFSYGNYFLEKRTFYVRKEWSIASQIGFGIEVLTKGNMMVSFNAAFLFPFNTKYSIDFIRSAGIGVQLNKKKK